MDFKQYHMIYAPKNLEGYNHFEYFIEDPENVHEEELTEEEYDALYWGKPSFFDLCYEKWKVLVGLWEEAQLPAEHVAEALELANAMIAKSSNPAEISGLEKVKRALEVAVKSGYYIEFDN